MLVAGNNLSACVGPAVGARILTKKTGSLIGAAGLVAGLLTQGSGMVRSVDVLLPNATAQLQAEILIVAILVFVVAEFVRVPMSLSMSLVGLLAGLYVARGTSAEFPFVIGVAVTWVVAPIISAVVAFYLIRGFNKREPRNIWQRIQLYRILLFALSFTTAYVLGANTLGLIVATTGFRWETVSAAVVAAFVGAFFLSEGAIRRVSQEFYLMRYSNATVTLLASTLLVESATLFAIPLSNTLATSAAVLGTGMSYKVKFMSAKPFLTIAAGWITAPLLCFMIGLLLG
jgi:PiT family inorganic phosphate transporter